MFSSRGIDLGLILTRICNFLCGGLTAESYTPEMSGLSYFTMQIQSWIFKTQSKSKRNPKIVKCKLQKINKIQLSNNKNAAILFHWLSPNPVLILNFLSDLQSGSNPSPKKFVIVLIQSNQVPSNAHLWYTQWCWKWNIRLRNPAYTSALTNVIFDACSDTVSAFKCEM